MRYTVIIYLLFLVSFSFSVAADNLSLSITIGDGADYANTTSVMLGLDGSSDAHECNLSNDDSNYSYSITPSFPETVSWTLLDGDGSKTVYFKCSNSSENASWSAAVTDSITLDSTSPIASSLTPSNASVTADTTPTISAQLADSASGVNDATFVLTVDSTDVSADASFNSVTGILSYTPTTALSVASHDVVLQFYDLAGNEAEYSWSFTVNSGITLSNPQPTDGSFNSGNHPTVSVDVTESGSAINTSRNVVRIDGVDYGANSSYSDGVLSYTVQSTLDDGEHTVEMAVYDNTGVTSSLSWSFTVDTVDPIITNPMPADLSTQSSISTIYVDLSDAGSGLNISSITMYVDSVEVTDGTDFDAGRLFFGYTSGLGDGSHNIEVNAQDNAGNSESFYWTFTIERGKPVLSSTIPEKDAVINNQKPEISAVIGDTGSGSLNVDSLNFYLDAKKITSGVSFDEASGTVRYTPPNDLLDGLHNVRIKISNEFGNTIDETWSFTVDTTPSSGITNLVVKLEDETTVLSWTEPSSDVSGYEVYAQTEKFGSIAGLSPVKTLDAGTSTYNHDGSKHYYFAVVSFDSAGNKAVPLFGQNCGTYRNGKWTDYDCCWDSDCDSGVCDRATHACGEEVEEEPETEVIVIEITEENASKILEQAEQEILDAAMSGKNVSQAGALLNQAKSAYNAKNYEQAYELANKALIELKSTKLAAAPSSDDEKTGGKKKLPCCPVAILPVLLILSVFFYRKR